MSDLEHYLGRISEHLSDISENVRRDSFFKKSACVAFGAKLSVDGNQFCFLLGDDLQSGIAGFGDTPSAAMLDFDSNFHTYKLGSSK